MSTYIPVLISDLPFRESYGFDLYLTYNKKFILFRHKSLPVDEGMINQLRDNGVERIYILDRDYHRYLSIIYASPGGSPPGDESNACRRHLSERFTPIEPINLKPGSNPSFTVFKLKDGVPLPLFSPDMPGVSQTVDSAFLEVSGSLYVLSKDQEQYVKYINETWREFAKFTPMNWEGGLLVRENAKMAAMGLFHDTNPGKSLEEASESVTNMVDRVLDNPNTYYALLKVSEQDFSTYVHSVNVAVLAMGLGVEMKLSDQEVHHLGMGGLLHDIGKRELDASGFWSRRDLSPEQYEEVKEHVILGREFCEKRQEISQEVIRIVSEHHERLDGSGFPGALRRERLGVLGQIVALMEIYDTLTNHQAFRKAFTPFNALRKMRQMGDRLNQEILSIFIRLLGSQRKD